MKKQPLISLTLFSLMCLVLTLIVAACGDATATSAPRTTGTDNKTTAPYTNAPFEPANTTVAAATTVAPKPTFGAAATTTAAPAAGTTAAATTVAAASGASSDSSGDSKAPLPVPYATPLPGSYTNPQPVNQDPLKAGSVDDNLKFDEYMTYLRNYKGSQILNFDVSERYIINVLDGNARTVANSLVRVYAGQDMLFEGKTYSNGQTMFFPRAIPNAKQAQEFTVTAEKNGRSISKQFKRVEQGQEQNRNGGGTWTLDISGSLRPQLDPPANLDLLFLIDSTGSMGGEIRKIQQTISDIANQISTLPGNPRVRYGVVTYRDRGDSYVTRKFGFTENLGEFSNFLNSISAGGGGDYPESLNEGLHVAVNDMNWNSGEAVRLVFLVADAPPHLDYANDFRYTDESVEAMRRGIKIYAIGASGLDPKGEFVFRQIAQITLAQYLFITRGGDENQSGSGGPASNTNVVTEERTLDKIVLNIVRREVTNLTQ